MDQRVPEFREPVASRADIIRATGLDPAAVDRTGLPIEEVSCGVAFMLLPVDTRAADGAITRAQVGGKAVRVGHGDIVTP